jgi:hypothetical protein
MIEFFKKLNNFINDSYNDKGWMGIIVRLILVSVVYTYISWSPEIHSWTSGKKISDFVTPERHQWHMILANGMLAVCLFAAIFRAFQLIKHKDWFNQIRNNKKLADQRLDEEIELRKQEQSGKTDSGNHPPC